MTDEQACKTLPGVAVIGECMIELTGVWPGRLDGGFGGDAINTAIGLRRHRASRRVSFATGVGGDPLSAALVEAWQAEGLDVTSVVAIEGGKPGLYLIQTDPEGERSFVYWRSDSAARQFVGHGGLERLDAWLHAGDWAYLTGISLAILPAADRKQLLEWLGELAARGVSVAFDPNFRESLWADGLAAAREAYRSAVASARVVMATLEDERLLWGDGTPEETAQRLRHAGVQDIVLKDGANGCLLIESDRLTRFPAATVTRVVDTTGAGDAFNAGFLDAYLAGRAGAECAQAGNAAGAKAVTHHGALSGR